MQAYLAARDIPAQTEAIMDFIRVFNAYFSPSGTTKKIASSISSVISDTVTAVDFLLSPPAETLSFGENDVLVIGMPVFSGRIPQVCVPYIKNLNGNGSPAIAVVVYGNRAYDDSLLELCDLLENQNFRVIGAAAFIGQHSFFNDVAAGRPDNSDFSKIIQFASVCSQKLESFEGFSGHLNIKGNHPYKPAAYPHIRPKVSSNCTKCGLCAGICPVGAIDIKNIRKTDKNKCISCTACIAVCPSGARAFKGFPFKIANKVFIKKFSARLEPEWFT